MAIRYVSPAVRQDSPFKPLALLARGHDGYGHFELRDPPERDAHDAEAQAAITARIRAGVLQGARPGAR